MLGRILLNMYKRHIGAKSSPTPEYISALFNPANAPLARNGSLHQMSQAGGIKLMTAMDRLLRENKIDYYMAGGAIIGVLRHGGNPIPWDDDIDICFMADDYRRLIDVLKRIIPNDEFMLWHWRHFSRLIHKPSGAFIDIFRHNFIGSDEPYVQDDGIIKKLLKKYQGWAFLHALSKGKTVIRSEMSVRAVKKAWIEVQKTLDRQLSASNRVFSKLNGAKATAVPLSYSPPANEFFHRDTLYPTRRVMYGGAEFSFPNDMELYTLKLYGDIYTKMTSDLFRMHHNTVKNRMRRFFELKRLLAMSDDQVYKLLAQPATV